ncbi:hypothetical protein E2H14_24725 [Salmonella enterica subsp. enterica serovar Muenchen]|nr:hypothetical protein [Salmonella enterica subsp. enterica serovar Muenchen]
MKHKSGFKSVVMVVMLLVIFTDVASAVMGHFGEGRWQYSGDITMEGEATFRPKRPGQYEAYPLEGVRMECPVRIQPTRCNVDIMQVYDDGSTAKVGNGNCSKAGDAVMRVGPGDFNFQLNRTYKFIVRVSARYTPNPNGGTGNAGLANMSSALMDTCPVILRSGYTDTLVSGSGTLRVTSDSGHSITFPLYTGASQLGSMPANSGSGTALIEYKPGLVLNSLPDNSAREEILRMISDTASASISYSIIPLNGALPSGGRLIKRDGSDCRSLVKGDVCDLYFPPGSTPVGQKILGLMSITITTY